MNKTQWHILSSTLLFIIIALSYSNTLTAAWHLDDYPNILQNTFLHIEALSSQALTQTFFAHPLEPGRLFRPVANFTFALNWYLGGDDVLGYHIVNIILHFATTFLLYLTSLKILSSPLVQVKEQSNRYAIALIAAFIWGLNPIQTQAVTYIVQRMALLATFFYIASLYCYLTARLSGNISRKLKLFLASLLFFFLALGSKENSITLPVSLLLVEVLFFQSKVEWNKKSVLMAMGLLSLTFIALYHLIDGDPTRLIAGYEQRSFSLWQRLLTEPRILVFYLSQLFYPAPHRLSLDHDISLSASLTNPATTLLSILFLVTLAAWAFWYRKKYRLASFGVLFFLLNHIIESTFIPLELIFEHRNYLPSLFLFLPLSKLLIDSINSKAVHKIPAARVVLPCILIVILLSLPVGSYLRNSAWATERSLWEDSLKKAPGQSRPYINLAVIYQQMGELEKAFELCTQSLSKNSPTPEKDRMRAYNNMGNIMMDKGDPAEAVTHYQMALAAKDNRFSKYYLHKAFLANGRTDAAKAILEGLMLENPQDSHLMTSMGIVLAVEKRYNEAAELLQQAVDIATEDQYQRTHALLCLGSVLSRQGNFKDADQLLRQTLTISEPIVPLLCIIGNHLNNGNSVEASAQLEELQKFYSAEQLVKIINSSARNNILLPMERRDLAEYILEHGPS